MPNLVQCWFPGVHVNSGGGSEHNLKTIVSFPLQRTKSFAWMVDRCAEFLAFDPDYLQHTARIHDSFLQARHSPEDVTTPPPYAVGPIKDSYVRFIGYFYGGSAYRTPGQYDERNKYDKKLVASDTTEFFHPSVRARWTTMGAKWRPEALRDWTLHSGGKQVGSESGWVWVKQLADGKSVSIPEFRVDTGEGSFERAIMGQTGLSQLTGVGDAVLIDV